MRPKYTFLLPAYKERFLAEALVSIKRQVYSDFLCIVSDDRSPDNLKSIFDDVVGDDARFVFRRNEENMGSKSLVSHWNLLVDMCETEYFIMASDDDVYEPNFLEEIDVLVEKHPNVDLFRAKVRCVNGNGELQIRDMSCEEYLGHLDFMRLYYSGVLLKCEACFCYRKSIVIANGKYSEFPLAWFSDDAEHIMISKNGCAVTSDVLFNYRASGLEISCNTNNPLTARKKVEAALLFHDWFEQYGKSIENSTQQRLKDSVVNKVMNNTRESIVVFSKKLNLMDFVWLCKNLQGRLGLSSLVLFYYWVLNKYGKKRVNDKCKTCKQS